MATWTYFRYGTEHHQVAKFWRPATGTNRGCLIYVPGGGWSVTSERGFYESTVKKPVFSKIEASEAVAGEQVVCISTMYSLAAYDFPQVVGGQSKSWPAWNVSAGTYAWDTYVFHNGSGSQKAYRCIQQHTAAADKEPGAGANWAQYWVEPPKNDIGNRTEGSGAQQALYTRCMSRPGYYEHGAQDVATLVQFVKQNAVFFGIDPDKVVLYGDSAGGSTCGTVAYSYSREWSAPTSRVDTQARDLIGARRDLAYHDSSVAGAILEITPSDFRHFADYTVQHSGFLMGIYGTGAGQDVEYGYLPQSLKASLSPLGALRASGRSVPTYLYYPGSQPGDGQDPGDPPWTTVSPYHHAANGVLLEAELARLGQANRPFYHGGNAPADVGQSMLDWLRALWGYPLS